MIKYYCDICGKEVNKKPNDYTSLHVPNLFGGKVMNNDAWDMCDECAREWYNCFIKFKAEHSKKD